jgi:hypothetical protein
VERWTPSIAISTTLTGSTHTVFDVRRTSISWNLSVCQRSSSSVSPLNVLPTMT